MDETSRQHGRVPWGRTAALGLLLGPILFVALSGSGSPAARANGAVTASTPVSTVSHSLDAPAVGVATDPAGQGYWEVASNGQVVNFGAPSYGTLNGHALNAPIVGLAATRSGGGYWEVGADGGIFAFGDAPFDGSMGGKPLNRPVVGMALDPATGGYWEVASDGGIFSFTAPYYGSMGGKPLNQPVVAMVATTDGGGYWEVAADGGIFAFGDATFDGSMGGKPLNRPIVGMAADPATGGYWEVASDGGIFSFGGAPFYGSMGGKPLNAPMEGVASSPGGTGYLEVGADGGIFSFGGAQFLGAATPAAHPYLPPSNPPADIPPDPAYTFVQSGSVSPSVSSTDSLPPCWVASGTSVTATPGAPGCIEAELAATDDARANEGLGNVQLPSNFSSLTPQEQLFVITDIERVSRGEAPVIGLSSTLDSIAQEGATAGTDPHYDFSIPSSIWWGANWAGGVINALDANYTWMYNDGWDGADTYNIDCTSPTASGCWGHRDNILTSGYGGTLVMGAGYAPEAAGVASLSELFVAVSGTANVPPLYYTWADALAAGAAG